MSKDWQPYAHHILDTVAKIRRIQDRGSITEDDILYDAVLATYKLYPKPLNPCPKT
jgi:hypothetical protein